MKSEIARYRQEQSFGLKYTESMAWWKSNRYTYPHLSNVMMRYLIIPVSSVQSERVFSTAGNISNKAHNYLTGENTNLPVFLYHNNAKFRGEVSTAFSKLI